MNDLNEKQKRFCHEYIIDLHITNAAKRAGYSEKTAYSQGEALLKKPEIQSLIQQLVDDRAKRTGITADKVIKEISKIAFTDIKDYLSFNDTGLSFKNSEDVDGSGISEVTSITTTTRTTKEETTEKVTLRLKLWDKVKALEMLGRHLRIFNDGELPPQRILINLPPEFGKPFTDN